MSGQKNGETSRIAIPLLSEVLGEVPVGRSILVVYDADSQWNMLLVNICSEYLHRNGNAVYATFSRPHLEIREDFKRLGTDFSSYEKRDTVLLFDGYSAVIGKRSSERYHAETLNLNELSVAITQSAPQWPSGTLYNFESLSALAAGQENVFGRFYRKVVSTWKAHGAVIIFGVADGIHPAGFYQELKLINDGSIELRLAEQGQEIVNTIRARSMKGQNVDSKPYRVLFNADMKASLKPM